MVVVVALAHASHLDPSFVFVSLEVDIASGTLRIEFPITAHRPMYRLVGHSDPDGRAGGLDPSCI